MRIIFGIIITAAMMALIAWRLHSNREWKDPDKVVDEFCGMEDLNRYHIQHHYRDSRIMIGMAISIMVLIAADILLA